MKKIILFVAALITLFATTNIHAQQLLTGGTASANSSYSGSAAGAFDGDISTNGWMNQIAASWLEYDLPQSQIVTNYSLISGYLQSSTTSYLP